MTGRASATIAGPLRPRAGGGAKQCPAFLAGGASALPVQATASASLSVSLVTVRLTDFPGETPAANAVESMSGFTLVLASLKLWLEHGIEGDLMYDKFPDAKYADR